MSNGGNTPQTAIPVPNGLNATQAHAWELNYLSQNYSGYQLVSETSSSTSTPDVYLHHYVILYKGKNEDVYFLWDDNDHRPA